MWADIYPSSGIVVSHMVIKLKREADSLEVDIQIFISNRPRKRLYE